MFPSPEMMRAQHEPTQATSFGFIDQDSAVEE